MQLPWLGEFKCLIQCHCIEMILHHTTTYLLTNKQTQLLKVKDLQILAVAMHVGLFLDYTVDKDLDSRFRLYFQKNSILDKTSHWQARVQVPVQSPRPKYKKRKFGLWTVSKI